MGHYVTSQIRRRIHYITTTLKRQEVAVDKDIIRKNSLEYLRITAIISALLFAGIPA
jgi:hypothetical protein